MSLHRLGTIIGIELRQRVRSVAWYVLLGVFVVVLLAVTTLSFAAFSFSNDGNQWFFSIVIMLVLLLTLLVSPTLSGSAVNGDRDSATLAPVQVTLVTTTEIVVGKFLAAWVSGLAFLVVALPFLIVATFAGALNPGVIVSSLGILVLEVGIVAAVGVGLSAVVARPLFSVASTYLVIAALTIGTLIAFGLGGMALRSEQRQTSYDLDWASVPVGCDPFSPSANPEACPSADEIECVESSWVSDVPRFDRVWWILAANPFVVLADATPPTFDENGYPSDLFSQIASGVRSAQIAPEETPVYNGCAPYQQQQDRESPEEVSDRTSPSWFVGLLVQLLLAAGLMAWGIARTRTPAKRLPPGTRIA